jgi:aarF domain-containing kinase
MKGDDPIVVLGKKKSPIKKQSAGDLGILKTEVGGNPQVMSKGLSQHSRESRIPDSPLQRLVSFGGLAVNLGFGAASEAVKQMVGGERKEDATDNMLKSVFMSERNARVLVESLCKMRGAALKLGQFLSIQDESIIPKELVEIFDRVRQDADIMPLWQTERILVEEFGEGWRDLIKEFEEVPIAAASIGQVHRVTLHDGRVCVMKIQYPGVSTSIESDCNNLLRLMNMTNLIPPGMYLEKALAVLSKELALECDYVHEAENQREMKRLLGDDPVFYVPTVVDELSTMHVLTSEYVEGVRLESLLGLSQEARNRLGYRIMELCLNELFVWKFMQVDPNFSNFSCDVENERINLLDFGACLKFDDDWVELYRRVILGELF